MAGASQHPAHDPLDPAYDIPVTDAPHGHNPNLSDLQFGMGSVADWGGTASGADLPDTGDSGLGYPAAY